MNTGNEPPRRSERLRNTPRPEYNVTKLTRKTLKREAEDADIDEPRPRQRRRRIATPQRVEESNDLANEVPRRREDSLSETVVHAPLELQLPQEGVVDVTPVTIVDNPPQLQLHILHESIISIPPETVVNGPPELSIHIPQQGMVSIPPEAIVVHSPPQLQIQIPQEGMVDIPPEPTPVDPWNEVRPDQRDENVAWDVQYGIPTVDPETGNMSCPHPVNPFFRDARLVRPRLRHPSKILREIIWDSDMPRADKELWSRSHALGGDSADYPDTNDTDAIVAWSRSRDLMADLDAGPGRFGYLRTLPVYLVDSIVRLSLDRPRLVNLFSATSAPHPGRAVPAPTISYALGGERHDRALAVSHPRYVARAGQFADGSGGAKDLGRLSCNDIIMCWGEREECEARWRHQQLLWERQRGLTPEQRRQEEEHGAGVLTLQLPTAPGTGADSVDNRMQREFFCREVIRDLGSHTILLSADPLFCSWSFLREIFPLTRRTVPPSTLRKLNWNWGWLLNVPSVKTIYVSWISSNVALHDVASQTISIAVVDSDNNKNDSDNDSNSSSSAHHSSARSDVAHHSSPSSSDPAAAQDRLLLRGATTAPTTLVDLYDDQRLAEMATLETIPAIDNSLHEPHHHIAPPGRPPGTSPRMCINCERKAWEDERRLQMERFYICLRYQHENPGVINLRGVLVNQGFGFDDHSEFAQRVRAEMPVFRPAVVFQLVPHRGSASLG